MYKYKINKTNYKHMFVSGFYLFATNCFKGYTIKYKEYQT